MTQKKTDNSFLIDKVFLRLNHLPKKQEIKVLDCYGGDGHIWKEVQKRTKQKISVLKIEKKCTAKGIYLCGDNEKFLQNIDFSKFDVVDFDAYGIPFKQLEIFFQKYPKNVVVFVTAILTMQGGLQKKMLEKIGYSKKMIEKIPTLFAKNEIDKIKQYLAINGVKKIWLRKYSRKNYLCFKT